jgi:ABC-type microcin C transport system permease subunit YejB
MKTKMKDDLEDIPMAYLWYVILAIMAIVIAAVAVVSLLY